MPMRGDLPVIVAQRGPPPPAAAAMWARCRAVAADVDLQCVVSFCAIGLLLAINMILLVPGYSETMSSLQVFP